MTTTLMPPSRDTDPGEDLDGSGTDLELATVEVVDGELVDDQDGDREEEAAVLPVVTVAPSVRMKSLSPHALMDNPRNSPDRLRDLGDLTSSMPIVGVLEPLVVVPLDPPVTDTAGDGSTVTYEFMLLIGHRRKYAAIEVGLDELPCWIVDDHGPVYHTLAQLLENSHRAALTASEEAECFHQLTLAGWNERQIAQIRAIPATLVRKTLQVRALPQAAKQAIDVGAISFEEGQALAEFEDTPSVYNKLVAEIGNTWRFQHALASARDSRDYTAAKDLVKAKLVLDGVKVTSRPKKFGYDSTEVDVRQLTDADGNPLDPQQVKTMPGMAAFIERNGTSAKEVVYCVAPDRYGYRRQQSPRYPWMSPEQAAAKEAEEQAKAELREQLRLAFGVRREYIRATWGTSKAARSLYVAALRADLIGQDLDYDEELTDLYTALGGADHDGLVTAGEDKLRRSLVARWLCAMESNLEEASSEHPWSFDERRGLAFYEMLMAGDAPYELSDAEAAQYETLRAKLAEPTDHDDQDGIADTGDEVQAAGVPEPAQDTDDEQQDSSPEPQPATDDLDDSSGATFDGQPSAVA